MKNLLILLILLFFTVANAKNNVTTENNVQKNDNNINNSINNNEILIKIVDKKTLESLSGVKCGKTYSDLNGYLKVNKGDVVILELISYNKVILQNVYSDTIITMSMKKLYLK